MGRNPTPVGETHARHGASQTTAHRRTALQIRTRQAPATAVFRQDKRRGQGEKTPTRARCGLSGPGPGSGCGRHGCPRTCRRSPGSACA